MKIGIFYFLPKRKKVRFTVAFGGARGGANGCSKYLHLERVFFTETQYFASHQNRFGFLLLLNKSLT